MENQEIYEHLEKDTDDNYYYFMNNDVVTFSSIFTKISDVFGKYEKKIKQTQYIKGNYLYFTFKKIKYYYSISSSADEENYIEDIKKELSELGCSNFYYNRGYLD